MRTALGARIIFAVVLENRRLLFSVRKLSQLSQLAVLAAAPIVETEARLLFFGLSLASNT